MRSFRETHLKIYLLPSSYPPIFKKFGDIKLKYVQKNYVH